MVTKLLKILFIICVVGKTNVICSQNSGSKNQYSGSKTRIIDGEYKIKDNILDKKDVYIVKKGSSVDISFEHEIVGVVLSNRDSVGFSYLYGDRKKAIIFGKKAGEVEITFSFKEKDSVKYKKYKIIIEPSEDIGFFDDAAIAEILQTIKKMRGVKYSMKDNKIRIFGRVYTVYDDFLLNNLMHKYSLGLVDETEKPIFNIKKLVTEYNDFLKSEGYENFYVESLGSDIILKGSPNGDKEKKNVMEILKKTNPYIKDGISENIHKGLVAIDILFFQLTNGGNFEVGFKQKGFNKFGELKAENWSGEIQKSNGIKFPVGRRGKFPWSMGPFSTILGLLESSSHAKFLSNSKMIVRSGKSASFRTGVDFMVDAFKPSQSATVAGQQVVSQNKETHIVETGTSISITPNTKPLGIIDLSVQLEMSDFISSEGSNTSKVISSTNTEISLKSGHGIIINGFNSKKNRKSVSKIPFLGDIPLLGELFKSRRFDEDETEVVILLTSKQLNYDDDVDKQIDILEVRNFSNSRFIELNKRATKLISFSIFD